MTPTRDDWSQFGMPPDPLNGSGPGNTALMGQSDMTYGPFGRWLASRNPADQNPDDPYVRDGYGKPIGLKPGRSAPQDVGAFTNLPATPGYEWYSPSPRQIQPGQSTNAGF